MARLGLIVNPVAGLGGRAGLKGSDGIDVQRRALALGARPEAGKRAVRALKTLLPLRERLEIISYPGEMGEDAAREAGFEPGVLGRIEPGRTTPEDTRRAARQMRDAGIALLLFAGGDGTARNVYEAIGETLPVIGIPAGVKIHSAIYAVSPEAAGWLARDFLEGRIQELILAEVMDIDEEAFRQGVVAARLYGYMKTPSGRRFLQGMKAASAPSEAAAQDAIAEEVVAHMRPGWLYVVGPGTTTRAIFQRLGLPKTLLGVDAVRDGRLAGRDLNARQIEALVQEHAPRVKIIVTPIGGQGFLFGRGNQQISPEVLRRVGPKGLIVVATRDKIHRLEHRPLLVDSGDPEVDALFKGYVQVITGVREAIVYPVRAAGAGQTSFPGFPAPTSIPC